MQKIELVPIVEKLLQDEVDPDLVAMAANWYVNELSIKNHLRIFEGDDTISASAGDTTADFPSDMQKLISLYMTVPQVMEFESRYLGYKDFMANHANFATASPAIAFRWTDWKNAMRFSQPLSVDHTFQVDYLRTPTPVEDDEDEFELPSQYDEMLARGTFIKILRINEDYKEADKEMQYLTPLEQAFIKNEARGAIKTGPVIIRTRRRPVRE